MNDKVKNLCRVDHIEFTALGSLMVSNARCKLDSAPNSLLVRKNNQAFICCVRNDNMCPHFEKIIMHGNAIGIECRLLKDTKG